MKEVIYKIIYFPLINKPLIQLVKLFNKIFNKKQILPPSGICKYQLPNNKSVLIDSNQTSFLTKVIYWNGLESFEYTSLFFDFISQFKVFIDIGANIGYYSLLAAKTNKEIIVYAFEPATGPFTYLIRNIKLNDLNRRIQCYQIALSDKIGEAEFYEFHNPKYKTTKYNLGGTSSLDVLNQSKLKSKTIIKTQNLDQFISDNKLENVDLIKIDTEGTENIILGSSVKTLSKYRPIVICETLFNKIEPQLEKIFLENNYKFFNHFNNKLFPVETIIRTKDNGIRDCFFVPEEKVHLVSKFITS